MTTKTTWINRVPTTSNLIYDWNTFYIIGRGLDRTRPTNIGLYPNVFQIATKGNGVEPMTKEQLDVMREDLRLVKLYIPDDKNIIIDATIGTDALLVNQVEQYEELVRSLCSLRVDNQYVGGVRSQTEALIRKYAITCHKL